MSSISDATFEQIKSLCNQTIHELVFLTTHAENNEPEEVNEILTTIQLNLNQLEDLVKNLPTGSLRLSASASLR